MKAGAQILGLDKVGANLNKEILKIKGRSMKGLIEAAAFIRRDMEQTDPKIPVDTGNLRASWFTTTIRQTVNIFGVLMGFTANYAVWVHEMVDAVFKRPGAGAKFFEYALKRNKQKILEIIRNNARIR